MSRQYRVTSWTAAFGAMVLIGINLAAQNRTPVNPRDGDPTAVRAGGALFRERCAECHGADGQGVAGHDLTRLWASGADDSRVFQTIRTGVPNTLMPSSAAPEDELWALVAYLRSLNGPVSAESAKGNTAHGDQIYWADCGSCHAVNGRGGRLGPDLSRIGQNQSREALTRAIRDPDSAITAGYRAVTLVTRDGQKIRGAMKSEDAFSIQIMDTHQQLQGFLKSRLREVVREAASLMPAFGPDRLNDGDLNDLLLFLNTLRGPGSGQP
jgi:putative heme-binding domain-containing protein